jgi:hypothetical protein
MWLSGRLGLRCAALQTNNRQSGWGIVGRSGGTAAVAVRLEASGRLGLHIAAVHCRVVQQDKTRSVAGGSCHLRALRVFSACVVHASSNGNRQTNRSRSTFASNRAICYHILLPSLLGAACCTTAGGGHLPAACSPHCSTLRII